jgi:hypothetical protein
MHAAEDGEFVLVGGNKKLLEEERAREGGRASTEFSWWPISGWSPCCCCYRGENDELARTKAKVPEITILFWIIKLLTTGLGEVCSDAMSAYSAPVCVGVGLIGALICSFCCVSRVLVWLMLSLSRSLRSHTHTNKEHQRQPQPQPQAKPQHTLPRSKTKTPATLSSPFPLTKIVRPLQGSQFP